MNQSFDAYAPGRVNLIGEHTDYNGGWVLPAALSVGLKVTLTPMDIPKVTVRSGEFGAWQPRWLEEEIVGHWTDMAVGAVREANAIGLLDAGAEISVESTIPPGAGLSSSAALLVAILKAARESAGSSLSDKDIAIAARRVETDYIGVPVGIMDQMAVAVSREGQAIALDTASLEYRLVSLPRGYSIEVLHSGVTRRLSDGRYKERKEECDAARVAFARDDICQLDLDTVEEAPGIDPVIRKRARHCASEHRRVVAAVAALEANDTAGFGALMNESHVSMRDDFEMSVPQIDALVESAVDEGALGARLTGGGFGGCIVACVAEDIREEWISAVLARHPDARSVDQIAG